VERYVSRCMTYNKTKSRLNLYSLYMSLPVPSVCWEDISIDFILGLPKTKRERDNIFIIVDRFSKMTEMIRLHSVPNTIILDRDAKFLNHFEEYYGLN
jgi:hypothetical protein